MRRLVIGDIHGCFAELQDLLEKAGVSTEDEIIAVGDIVDRGPETGKVLDWFRGQRNASSLMGNHERKHVRVMRGELRPALAQVIVRQQLGEQAYAAACRFMDSLPRFRELPEATLAHGFLEPGVQAAKQRETVLVGAMSGEQYLRKKYDRPWYDLYAASKPIKPLIVGHLVYKENGEPLVVNDVVYCIDTGCCHGLRLTGVLLPEFRIISVPSRRDYWSEQRRQYT